MAWILYFDSQTCQVIAVYERQCVKILNAWQIEIRNSESYLEWFKCLALSWYSVIFESQYWACSLLAIWFPLRNLMLGEYSFLLRSSSLAFEEKSRRMEAWEHKVHKAEHQETKCQIWTNKACWLRFQETGNKGFQPLFKPSLKCLKELKQYPNLRPSQLHFSSKIRFDPWCLYEEFSDHEYAWFRDKSKWTNLKFASREMLVLFILWFSTQYLPHQHTPSQYAFSSFSFCTPRWIRRCLDGSKLEEFWLP